MQKHSEKFGISDKRGRAQTSRDPFQPEKGMKEPALCRQCGALYTNKRWTLEADKVMAAKYDSQIERVDCPACQKIAQKYAEGYVTLRGDYLWNHEEQITALLKAQERKAMDKNPLERIIRIERSSDALMIETTEAKLAEHLARALHKAHHGEMEISWDEDRSLCRVHWQRD